jgi:hypothetical protein
MNITETATTATPTVDHENECSWDGLQTSTMGEPATEQEYAVCLDHGVTFPLLPTE